MKILLKLHNYLYYKISILTARINSGIHPKHRIMNYHQFFIDNIEKGSTVLDIGCGYGLVSYDIGIKAQKIVGIDKDKKSIDIAKQNYMRDNIKYILADAITYKLEEYFDYIVLSNVLEHIKNRIEFLKRIKDSAKILLIRVPMVNRSWLTIYKKDLGIEYRLDKGHCIEYTLSTFKRELNIAGLKLIKFNIQFGEIWAKIQSV